MAYECDSPVPLGRIDRGFDEVELLRTANESGPTHPHAETGLELRGTRGEDRD